jgi:hypothetical protein
MNLGHKIEVNVEYFLKKCSLQQGWKYSKWSTVRTTFEKIRKCYTDHQHTYFTYLYVTKFLQAGMRKIFYSFKDSMFKNLLNVNFSRKRAKESF